MLSNDLHVCTHQRNFIQPSNLRETLESNFRPLQPSRRKIGKYFLVVAGVFLLQILVGSIMALYYSGPDVAMPR
jgi:nitric oxide reductase subunit B